MKNKSMMTDPVLGSGMEELKQNPQQQGKLSDQSVGKNSRGRSSVPRLHLDLRAKATEKWLHWSGTIKSEPADKRNKLGSKITNQS
jgi:hypothetical protein